MRRALQGLVVDRVSSPLGPLLVVCDGEDHLRALDFHDHEVRMQRLLRLHYGAGRYSLASGGVPSAVTAALNAFFAGELHALDAIHVRTGGTDFQRRVWTALRRIPAGTTTTYGRLAASIERPSASRAVGLANGANPIGIVVPCHRVIGANGAPTGYAGGIERKRWLLGHERQWSSPAAAALEGSA